MTKTILFDVDHTLFDTARFAQEYTDPALRERCQLSEDRFKAIKQSYLNSLEKSTDFDPQALTDLLAKESQFDSGVIRELYFTPEFFTESVFPDVLPLLEQLGEGYRLGIYSEAVKEWQLRKLELSGLMRHFDPELIFITNNKAAADYIQQLPANSIVIDDRLDFIQALKGRPDLQPIWLNRESQQSHEGCITIRSLSELPQLLA